MTSLNDPRHQADLAHVAHLAAKVEELSLLATAIYIPAANRLWAAARPGGRRLVSELTLSTNTQQVAPAPGSLAAIAAACNEILLEEKR